MALLDSKIQKAENDLQEAFDNCPSSAAKNKVQILKYLIPVKIFCGKLPSKKLFQKYELFEYLKIAEGLATCNYKLFNKEVESYNKLWIVRKLYFFMQDLKLIFNRNLFKKVYQVINEDQEVIQNQIEIKNFVKALNWQHKGNRKFDIIEVECLLANLIYKGFIKGYIVHEDEIRLLILSKREPFPKIPKVIKKKYS